MGMKLHSLLLVMVCGIVTAALRAFPFLLFPAGKETPLLIRYLSSVLPSAVMGMLVIYCLKSVSLAKVPHGLPEFLAIAAVVLVHKWKRSTTRCLVFLSGRFCIWCWCKLYFDNYSSVRPFSERDISRIPRIPLRTMLSTASSV